MSATHDSSPEAVIETVMTGFSDRDFDTVASVHADDVVLVDNGAEFRGYDEVEEHMASTLAGLENLEFTIDDVVSDADRVACRYTVTATLDDEPLELTSLSLATVEDGQITDVWVHSLPVSDDGQDPDRSAMETENELTVRALYEAASGGTFDVDAFLGPLADDVEWIEPTGSPVGGTHHGPEEVMTILESMATDFESFEVVPDRYITSGDTVAVPVTERFTLNAGESVAVRALHLYELTDGRITRMENFEDTGLLY